MTIINFAKQKHPTKKGMGMKIQFSFTKKIPQRWALHNFSQKVLRHLPDLDKASEICVIFVSDGEIRNINKIFLKKNYATDVIAFNYKGSGSNLITCNDILPFGDIYISLDTAKRQAKKGKYPLYKELALLILHGLLHLVGYRDESPEQRKKMFALQKELFGTLNPRLAPPDFK